jgi:hypothetical protein
MFDIINARAEIEGRNRLRAEVRLPPLSLARELRKLYRAERDREFEAFFRASPLRKRIEARLLARCRRLRQEPEWRPTGMLSGGGWAFGMCVRKVMGRVLLIKSRLGQ